jgi:hypothetical protein
MRSSGGSSCKPAVVSLRRRGGSHTMQRPASHAPHRPGSRPVPPDPHPSEPYAPGWLADNRHNLMLIARGELARKAKCLVPAAGEPGSQAPMGLNALPGFLAENDYACISFGCFVDRPGGIGAGRPAAVPTAGDRGLGDARADMAPARPDMSAGK